MGRQVNEANRTKQQAEVDSCVAESRRVVAAAATSSRLLSYLLGLTFVHNEKAIPALIRAQKAKLVFKEENVINNEKSTLLLVSLQACIMK